MVKRTLNLKACPRCKGDLYIASDMYGDYAQCVQCGYMKDLEIKMVAGAVAEKTARKKAA